MTTVKIERAFIHLRSHIYLMNMQSASSIWSYLLSNVNIIEIASGEANVYGSSYYWNLRISSFKQVACLKLIVLKEQLGDILFISFVIASGEAIIFYFEWIL
jgi:hypothetical protein